MERIQRWVVVAVIAFAMAWVTPVAADEGGEWPAAIATTVSGETAAAQKLSASAKKKAKKRKAKKKKKKKAPVTTAKKHALGLKGVVLPINDMNVNFTGPGSGSIVPVDYDFGIIWGWGLQYQYRIAKNFYACGEFLYWYPEVSDTEKHPVGQAEFREPDGLVNLGVGLRLNIMGGEATTDRVYLKGHVGFTDYVANDSNTDSDNRAGVYFNAGGGIEHKFSRTFTVFADGGYFYNSFTSVGEGEEDGTLQGIVINGGFLFHWDS